MCVFFEGTPNGGFPFGLTLTTTQRGPSKKTQPHGFPNGFVAHGNFVAVHGPGGSVRYI